MTLPQPSVCSAISKGYDGGRTRRRGGSPMLDSCVRCDRFAQPSQANLVRGSDTDMQTLTEHYSRKSLRRPPPEPGARASGGRGAPRTSRKMAPTDTFRQEPDDAANPGRPSLGTRVGGTANRTFVVSIRVGAGSQPAPDRRSASSAGRRQPAGRCLHLSVRLTQVMISVWTLTSCEMGV